MLLWRDGNSSCGQNIDRVSNKTQMGADGMSEGDVVESTITKSTQQASITFVKVIKKLSGRFSVVIVRHILG